MREQGNPQTHDTDRRAHLHSIIEVTRDSARF